MSKVVISRYGRAASEQLAAAVGAAKAASPSASLAPVTVVVPSNFAGLVARRLLGSGQLGGTGIANVNFLTPFRLAELLAVGQLRGKRPLTNPVLGAAVRQALRDDPRHFARVRDHQATEQAIAAVVGELSNVSVQGVQAIQDMGGFAGSVIELHRSVVGRLRDFHDEAELARAATHRHDLVDALAPFGPIIWHLPGVISAPLGLFLRAVLAAVPSTVIVGLSGVPEADEQVRRSLMLAQVELPAETTTAAETTAAAAAPPLAGHVVSVTDADEEVRQVIRQVVELVDGGVPLDRIGVFHPVPDPYVRMLEQHFAAAGIAANGPSRRRLSESIAGRVLLSALALPSERWRRDRVMALLSTAPIRHGDEVARPTSWDAVSRDAGVVLDLRDWHAKLASYLERLNRQHGKAAESGQTRRLTAIERGIADATSLQSFVTGLAEHVAAVDAADSWQARGDAAKTLLRDLLGPPHHHRWWPEAEQEAFDHVEAALERLAALDEIDPDPSTVVFARALSTELSVARGRSGRFGQGLVYGPLASAAGHDLDAVFILGCAEGILPAPRREDVLLSDDARRATGMDLPTRLGQMHEQHRLFLAALAAAPAERRWLFFPRGDLRSSRRSRPSRWLLPSATEIAGKPLFATDFEHETPPGLTEIASHAEAIASTLHPASLDERDLAEVLTFVRNDGDAVEHPAAEAVELGLRLQRARAGGDFTVFDGNLAGQQLPTTDERPQSASRLESWATCGFRYFLGHVLDLSDRDDPERTIELSALDRGSAMHAILEKFLQDIVDAGPPNPNEPWTPEQRAQARQIADDVFAEYEERGRTGRPVMWGTQKRDLLASIEELLDADNDHRADNQATPALFELAFGLDGAPPVEIPIGDDRRLRFRGFIDRIDTAGPGRMIVSDYKTGIGSQYRKLGNEADPTKSGTLLQLGLYAEAARQLLGAESVDTSYWMVNPRASYQRFGYEWTAEHHERLAQVVTTIVDGIESGVFAAAPGEWDSFRRTYSECAYCEFDPICPRDRAEHASEKLGSPELAVRAALVLSEHDADDSAAADGAA